MIHPFFDPKSLSDDELIKKASEVTRRLNYARSMIGDFQMIEQLEMILESLHLERQERMNKQSWDLWQAQFPETIESDPEFKKNKQTEPSKKPARQNGRPDNNFKAPSAPMVFKKEYNRNAVKDQAPKPTVEPEKDSGSEPKSDS